MENNAILGGCVMKKTLRILCCVLAAAALLCLASCGSDQNNAAKAKNEPTNTPTQAKKAENSPVPVTGELSQGSCKVLFTMSDGQTFTIQCEPEYAPETVENFLSLVNSGFYDGLTFHRVLDNFVAQGGDPSGNGTGGSQTKIHGEFSENGFTQNTLTHKRGSVAMARSSAPDSASSQFYICYTDLPSLDGKYAVFGTVTEGMEVIDSFLSIARDSSGMPSTPITIELSLIHI